MEKNFIYLDYNATTPLDPRVLDTMMPYLTDIYGNASSSHKMGQRIKIATERARAQVGDLIDANEEDVYFTAGATEAINIALRGVISLSSKGRGHIITVKTEHPAVLDTCRYLESIGVDITYLDVGSDGLIDLDQLRSSFRDGTIMVSVMMVNNETGVIQPIAAIADITHERGAILMTDGTQAVGKIPTEVSEYIDILAFSGHKFYAAKGIGGIYINPRFRIKPLIFGGGHERGLRSGTLNVPGIVGMGKAAELANNEMGEDTIRIRKLRDDLETALLNISGTRVNGSKESRIYTTSSMVFEGVDNDAMLTGLRDICVSNGSACHSFVMEPSHVLLAMGLSQKQANESIRFSIGRYNTEEDIHKTIVAVTDTAKRLRAMAF